MSEAFLYWFWTPSLLLYTTPRQESTSKVLLNHIRIENNNNKKHFKKIIRLGVIIAL